MNDEAFLRYCSIHSRTERALFHVDHVRRLADLAGVAVATSGQEWWALRSDASDPLIEMAREKIRQTAEARRTELLSAGFVEGVENADGLIG